MDLITRINALIDGEFEFVKSESATYGELKHSLEKAEKNIAWANPKLAEYVGERFRKRLDEELGGLTLKQKPPEESRHFYSDDGV